MLFALSAHIAFLTVPMFSIFLSLRNMAPWNRKEIVCCVLSALFYVILNKKIISILQLPLVLISCIGWVTNHFTATVFVNQLDVSAAAGYVSVLCLYLMA